MNCKYKNRLNDYNFCLVACAYCTLEQEITCKRKITINENAPTVDIKTEVAREIFAEIEKILVRPEAPTALFYHCSKHSYNELKNKYTKEGVE